MCYNFSCLSNCRFDLSVVRRCFAVARFVEVVYDLLLSISGLRGRRSRVVPVLQLLPHQLLHLGAFRGIVNCNSGIKCQNIFLFFAKTKPAINFKDPPIVLCKRFIG